MQQSARFDALPHAHIVGFYDDEAELFDRVADFLIDGLRRGEQAIVVATAEHRAGIADALARSGWVSADRVEYVDARQTLAEFLISGRPDPERFRASVGAIIARKAADGTGVRIFGEMVALLWQEGQVSAALELEALWNDLARTHEFALLCAYGAGAVATSGLAELAAVCGSHSDLAPFSADAGLALDSCEYATFLPMPSAVPAVRRFVAASLDGVAGDAVLADAVLVASELATNAVRHARSPFRVRVERSTGSLRICIEDGVDGAPHLAAVGSEAPSGRGVAIIDSLCTAWGSEPIPGGKVVWAELLRSIEPAGC